MRKDLVIEIGFGIEVLKNKEQRQKYELEQELKLKQGYDHRNVRKGISCIMELKDKGKKANLTRQTTDLKKQKYDYKRICGGRRKKKKLNKKNVHQWKNEYVL